MIQVSAFNLAVRTQLWSFFSTEAHTPTDMVRYLNSAIRELCDKKQWDWNKFNETYSITDINTPAITKNQISVFNVYDESGSELEVLNFEEYSDRKIKGWENGFVGCWGNTLHSNTVGTFTIVYSAYPATATSDTTTVDIPEDKMDLLVVIGSYFWYMAVQAFEKAAEMRSIWKWMVDDNAVRATVRKQNDTPRLWSNYSF